MKRMTVIVAVSVLAGLVTGLLGARALTVQASGGARKAIDPGKFFSRAVEAGDYVFTSGMVARGPDGKVIEGGIKPQTKQVMENLKATLAKAWLGMEHVVKTTVFLRNPEDFQDMNEVYREYLPTEPPARSTVFAGFPAKEALVEIEMIAYRGR